MIQTILPELLLIVKTLLLAFLITRAEPLHQLCQYIKEKSDSLILSILANLMSNELTTCLKCTSFWIGLLMTGNIYLAIIAFTIGFIYDKNLSTWETKTKLF